MGAYAKNYPILYIYIRENLEDVADSRSKWARSMKQINHDYDEAVISIIQQGYDDGSFVNLGSAKVVSYGVLGMVNWTNRWFKPDHSDIDAQAIGKMYANIITNGLASGTLDLAK